jgi:hypothetical protein
MHEPDSTAELIQKYLDQSVTPAETSALEERLTRDPQAAEMLAEAVRLESGLTRLFQAEERTAAALSQLFTGATAETHAASRPSSTTSTRSWRDPQRSMWAAAAGLLLAVGLGSWLYLRPHAPLPQVVAARNEIVAGDALINGAPGQTVPDGSSVQVLGYDSAVVRLTDGSRAEFDPGATALIHGRDAGLRQWVELNEGCGTFHVEKGDGEFEVATQLGSVTALGTEFSVEIRPTSSAGGLFSPTASTLLIVAVLSGAVQVEYGDQIYALAAGERRVFGDPAQIQAAEAARRIPTSAPPGTRRGDVANTIRGPINFLDRTKVVLGGGRRGTTEFALQTDVRLSYDGKPAAFEQFTRGMVVSVERKDGQGPVLGMHASGSTIGAKLLAIDAEKQSMTVLTGVGGVNSARTYPLIDNVPITLNGQAAKLSDLQPGMSVSLRLSVDFKTVIAVTRARRTLQ